MSSKRREESPGQWCAARKALTSATDKKAEGTAKLGTAMRKFKEKQAVWRPPNVSLSLFVSLTALRTAE